MPLFPRRVVGPRETLRPRVALCLRHRGRPHDAADLRARHHVAPARTDLCTHPLSRRLARGRSIRELPGSVHRERLVCRLDVRAAHLELLQAIDLSVHALECAGENLLAPLRLLRGPGKALAARLGLAAHLAPLLPRELRSFPSISRSRVFKDFNSATSLW